MKSSQIEVSCQFWPEVIPERGTLSDSQTNHLSCKSEKRRWPILDLIQAYRNYDPAAKSSLEVLFLYPGPKALFFHSISHFFYRIRLRFIARLISEIGRWLTLIDIHPGAKIGKRLVIDHGAGLVIGETAEIGDDCILFHGVTLGGTTFHPVKRHPTLGNNVLIGAGAKVLGPISLGDGVKVGANAVVNKDAPAGITLVGIPARAARSASVRLSVSD